MTSLLDAIFATINSGLFLITIFTTLFNLQASSQDTTFHVTLNNAAEVQYQELDNCLGKVGAGVYSGQILVAEPDSFVFKTKYDLINDIMGSVINTISISLGDSTSQGIPIKIMQNGVPLPGSNVPLWLRDLNFSYYDIDENQITTPGDSLSYIRLLKTDLQFAFETSYVGPGERNIITNLTFWKYFINFYL